MMLTTAAAVAAAQDWVRAQAAGMPGYCGAYLSGSVLERGMGEVWPADSDVDVVVVFEEDLPEKIGKIRHCGLLLEITAMRRADFADDEAVLSTHYLAFALNGGQVLDDPKAFLVPLSQRVQAAFWQEAWLLKRAETTAQIARRHISNMGKAVLPEEILMSGCFGPSAIALPILAAAGRNCTVRKRLPKARNVLQAYGFGAFSGRLEAVLGCEGLTAEDLSVHMDALDEVYCRAMTTEGASAEYPFRSDIRPEAKAVAVDGTREMLLGAHPSDAVFWLAATFARCMTILRMDDMRSYEEFLPRMLVLMQTLGIADAGAVASRQDLALCTLEEARRIAQEIARKTAK